MGSSLKLKGFGPFSQTLKKEINWRNKLDQENTILRTTPQPGTTNTKQFSHTAPARSQQLSPIRPATSSKREQTEQYRKCLADLVAARACQSGLRDFVAQCAYTSESGVWSKQSRRYLKTNPQIVDVLKYLNMSILWVSTLHDTKYVYMPCSFLLLCYIGHFRIYLWIGGQKMLTQMHLSLPYAQRHTTYSLVLSLKDKLRTPRSMQKALETETEVQVQIQVQDRSATWKCTTKKMARCCTS